MKDNFVSRSGPLTRELLLEPGKFGRQLVRGELTYPKLGTIEAHCRTSKGDTVVVPLTLLPPL